VKASKYNIYFNRNGKNYIYNTLACSILSCDVATLNALTSNQIDLLDKQTCMMLKKNGCVVSASLDETSVFKMHYNSVQYCSNPEELRLVILPTYQCNLRCTYCFEEDCKNLSIKMDRDKVCQIAAFVISEINLPQRNYKRVSVTLFGGEPFLYRDVCLDILEQISDICKEIKGKCDNQCYPY